MELSLIINEPMIDLFRASKGRAPHYFEIKMKGKRNSFVFPDKLGQLVPGEIQKNNQPN